MKKHILITVFVAAASLPAFAQGPKAQPKAETEEAILEIFKKDIGKVEQALTNTDFETGPMARSFGKDREQVLSLVRSSRAIVESMRTRVDEITTHFAALRSGGSSFDEALQLESFCANNNIQDLGQGSMNLLIEMAYEREAGTLVGIGALIEPVAAELWATNASWKLSDVALPSGYDPESESARQYIKSRQEAETKAHNAKLAAHQRLRDAVTHAGWAASRVRQLKTMALARMAAPAAAGAEKDPKDACKIAVAHLRESQLLAGTGNSGGTQSGGTQFYQGPQKTTAPR